MRLPFASAVLCAGMLAGCAAGSMRAPDHQPEETKPMTQKVRPFLMFEGRAEEAMNFYVSLLPGSEIVDIRRYGKGEAGPEGSVMLATFSLAGQTVMCIDSPAKHPFGPTPSFSFFVECESEEELRRLAAALGEGGEVMMPLDHYGFSRLFTWVSDRFGVSWQLNLK